MTTQTSAAERAEQHVQHPDPSCEACRYLGLAASLSADATGAEGGEG